jgi:hypothetical protein
VALKIGRAVRVAVCAVLLAATAALARDYRVEGPFDGLVEVSIPTDFRVMGDDERVIKYPAKSGPQTVFTNAAGNFDVTFTRNPGDISALPIDALRARVSHGLHLKQPFAKWHRDEVVEINGRQFARLEFTISAFDTNIRNILLETPADGAVLIIGINMPEANVRQWMPVAAQILDSVRVTKP